MRRGHGEERGGVGEEKDADEEKRSKKKKMMMMITTEGTNSDSKHRPTARKSIVLNLLKLSGHQVYRQV